MNTGTATLDISSITPSVNFAISASTCGATLNPGKKCAVSVTATPTQLGSFAGTLTFSDNASGSPQSVSLTGTGVAQGNGDSSHLHLPQDEGWRDKRSAQLHPEKQLEDSADGDLLLDPGKLCGIRNNMWDKPGRKDDLYDQGDVLAESDGGR